MNTDPMLAPEKAWVAIAILYGIQFVVWVGVLLVIFLGE